LTAIARHTPPGATFCRSYIPHIRSYNGSLIRNMAGTLSTGSGAALAVLLLAPDATPGTAPLVASETRIVSQAGGRNPTVAVDPRSGAVYLAWAQEHPGAAKKDANGPEHTLQVLVARSDDGGRRFGPAVVVSADGARIQSQAVSPTRIAVGPEGEVYVLYAHHDPDFRPAGWEFGRVGLRLVRSEDAGRHFSAPIEIGAGEGVETSRDMLNLFVAGNGDLYASFLDYREEFAYRIANGTAAWRA
jgi:hypothetical protein